MILPRRTFLTRLASLVAFPLVVPAKAVESILWRRSQIPGVATVMGLKPFEWQLTDTVGKVLAHGSIDGFFPDVGQFSAENIMRDYDVTGGTVEHFRLVDARTGDTLFTETVSTNKSDIRSYCKMQSVVLKDHDEVGFHGIAVGHDQSETYLMLERLAKTTHFGRNKT